jgi:hypothetical protein
LECGRTVKTLAHTLTAQDFNSVVSRGACKTSGRQHISNFTFAAAVLTALFGLTSHIKPVHRAAPARALGRDITKNGE